MAQDAASAEDLVQECFLVAIERSETWDPSRPVFPWLAGILTHKASDARRRARCSSDALAGLNAAAPTEQPEEVARARERSQLVAAAIEQLEAPYRDALTLHALHGLTAREIAHALGRSPAVVRVQLARGRALLRHRLPSSMASSGLLATGAHTRGLSSARRRVMRAAGRPEFNLPAVLLVGLAAIIGATWSLAGSGPRAGLAPIEPVEPTGLSEPDAEATRVAALSTIKPLQTPAPNPARAAVEPHRSGQTIQVLTASGDPLPGATIYAEPLAATAQDGRRPLLVGMTDEHGLATLKPENVASKWRVFALSPEGRRSAATSIWRGLEGTPQTQTLSIIGGDQPLWLHGRVVDAADGSPVSEVRIGFDPTAQFEYPDSKFGRPKHPTIPPTWTDAEGSFSLGPIDPKIHLGPAVVARKPGYGVRAAPWRRIKERLQTGDHAASSRHDFRIDAAGEATGLPGFGWNVARRTVHLQHVPIGTYRVSDGLGHSIEPLVVKEDSTARAHFEAPVDGR